MTETCHETRRAYNFYVNDARWGRMFVRMCPYLPFSARVASCAARSVRAPRKKIAATGLKAGGRPVICHGAMTQPLTNRERAARHRARLKQRGLRRAQLMLPDLYAPEMQARMEAACRRLTETPSADIEEVLAFAEAAWRDTPA